MIIYDNLCTSPTPKIHLYTFGTDRAHPCISTRDLTHRLACNHANLTRFIDKCIKRGELNPQSVIKTLYKQKDKCAEADRAFDCYLLSRNALSWIGANWPTAGYDGAPAKIRAILDAMRDAAPIKTESVASYTKLTGIDIPRPAPEILPPEESDHESDSEFSGMEFDFITLPDGTQAMTSMEIAKLTGKKHKHVIDKIREMVQALPNGPDFRSVYKDAKGEMRPCFHLPERECWIIVSGYSIELRAAIIDRWRELEKRQLAQAQRIPNHAEALRLAADAIERANREEAAKLLAHERIKVVETVVTELKPKAEALEKLEDDKGFQSLTEICQPGKYRLKTLTEALIEHGWLRRLQRNNRLAGTSYGIAKGYVYVIQSRYSNPRTGQNELSLTPYITPKGVKWINLNIKADHPAYLKRTGDKDKDAGQGSLNI